MSNGHELIWHWTITEKADMFYVEEWLQDEEYDAEFGPLASRSVAEIFIADRKRHLTVMVKKLLRTKSH